MSGTILYVCNQRKTVAWWIAEEAVSRLDHDLDQVYVLPLIEATDVVGFAVFSFMENQVDCTGMILNIEPVADILSLAVYRERFT